MTTLPACPQCTQEHTYPDGELYICADCGHEWPMQADVASDEAATVVKDANGNVLQDGDAVVLIKDLKVKGSSITLKQGSKVKSIRLVSGGDHEVDCRMEAGNFMLKACYLRKA
ncbi:zinc ribbon domain-containing protein YjdM [Chitinimonas lacunae]|uniref:Zinc ribbon domain-containing protein YjdM n=1 Tax=Chitinimonas lacunae TaxID=1963018 RepID=A0ABV8MNY3_9NEIS